MCYENMEDIWNTGKGIDPLTHKLVEEVFKQDSQNLEGIFDQWGWDMMAQEAQHNQEHPGQGIGKASVMAGSMMLPGLIGNAWGAVSPTVYEAAVPAVGAEQAALLAAQTGEFGAYGLGQTMNAAGAAQGLSGAQQAAGQAGGLMSKLAGGSGGTSQKKMMMELAMNNMGQQPQQPMPQAAPMRSPQLEPLTRPYNEPNPYGPGGNSMGLLGETEEERRRRRLRMRGLMG